MKAPDSLNEFNSYTTVGPEFNFSKRYRYKTIIHTWRKVSNMLQINTVRCEFSMDKFR